jgi:hypothetical protein
VIFTKQHYSDIQRLIKFKSSAKTARNIITGAVKAKTSTATVESYSSSLGAASAPPPAVEAASALSFCW